MGENTKIAWCDHTFNGWEGCTKVSAGCQHCYAETRNKRFDGGNWGKGAPRRRTSASNWKQPLKWNRIFACGKCGVCGQPGNRIGKPCECGNALGFERPRVFSASLSDWLDDEVPIEWLKDLMGVIHDTPNLDWLLLTKRPQNYLPRTRAALALCTGWSKREADDAFYMPENAWIGVSVENQKTADERIPELLKIPARIRFLSVEPMLERIAFPPVSPGINWMIFGGESGANARPCDIGWIRDGIERCRKEGIKPFVKQLGSNSVLDNSPRIKWFDKKGGDPDEWTPDLRVREFPA